MTLKKLTTYGIYFLLSVPTFAFAAAPNIRLRENLDKNSVFDIIDQLSQYLFALLVAITVFFVLYAAWLYLSSGGEAEETKKARDYLIFAAVAVAVGLFARSLPYIVDSILPK